VNPAPKPRLVVPQTSGRERLVAVIVGLIVLAGVIGGLWSMAKPEPSRNILVGVVEAKQFTPGREEQVSFSGRKLESTKTIEGEYILRVRVAAENRTYDVPVEKPAYDAKQPGDKLEFVRPPSEQR
jgi:hypothetical protein